VGKTRRTWLGGFRLFYRLVLGGECRSASAALLIHRLGADSAKTFVNEIAMCSPLLRKNETTIKLYWRQKKTTLRNFYNETSITS